MEDVGFLRGVVLVLMRGVKVVTGTVEGLVRVEGYGREGHVGGECEQHEAGAREGEVPDHLAEFGGQAGELREGRGGGC